MTDDRIEQYVTILRELRDLEKMWDAPPQYRFVSMRDVRRSEDCHRAVMELEERFSVDGRLQAARVAAKLAGL